MEKTKIIDFDKCELNYRNKTYGGAAGTKEGGRKLFM